MYIIRQLYPYRTGGSCWEEITNRYNLRQGSGDDRSDIYDGAVYQHIFQSGFLSNTLNISLIFNTDGIPVFRSSSFALWPVLFLVNKLPYRLRYIYKIQLMLHCSK